MQTLSTIVRAGIAVVFAFFLLATPVSAGHEPADIAVQALGESFYPAPDMDRCEPVVRDYIDFIAHDPQITPANESRFSDLRRLFVECFDRYTYIGTPEMLETRQASEETRITGVGVTVSQHQDGGAVIQEVREGSTLFGRVEVGDVIIGARQEGNQDYTDITILMAGIELIRGEVGSSVYLKIRREDGSEYEISATRIEFRISTIVDSRVLPGNVGYIKIAMFNDETADDFQEALLGMDVASVIIDLRDNPGGMEPVELGYYFSRNLDDIFFTTVSRRGEIVKTVRDPFNACSEHADRMIGSEGDERCPTFVFRGDQLEREITSEDYKEPGIFADHQVIILTNRNSASSSEVFAAFMQDWGKARDGQYIVLGEQTFGKAIGQATVRISEDNFFLYFTAMEAFFGNDRVKVHGTGVTPNVVVADTRTSRNTPDAEDAQLQRALSLLTGDRP